MVRKFGHFHDQLRMQFPVPRKASPTILLSEPITAPLALVTKIAGPVEHHHCCAGFSANGGEPRPGANPFPARDGGSVME